jgi:hypothetical protein
MSRALDSEQRGAKHIGDKVEMLKKILSAAVVGAGVMVTSTFGASAAIVCQGHVCWHVHDVYDFPHEAGVIIHEDGGIGDRTKGTPSVDMRAAATGVAADG